MGIKSPPQKDLSRNDYLVFCFQQCCLCKASDVLVSILHHECQGLPLYICLTQWQPPNLWSTGNLCVCLIRETSCLLNNEWKSHRQQGDCQIYLEFFPSLYPSKSNAHEGMLKWEHFNVWKRFPDMDVRV